MIPVKELAANFAKEAPRRRAIAMLKNEQTRLEEMLVEAAAYGSCIDNEITACRERIDKLRAFITSDGSVTNEQIWP